MNDADPAADEGADTVDVRDTAARPRHFSPLLRRRTSGTAPRADALTSPTSQPRPTLAKVSGKAVPSMELRRAPTLGRASGEAYRMQLSARALRVPPPLSPDAESSPERLRPGKNTSGATLTVSGGRGRLGLRAAKSLRNPDRRATLEADHLVTDEHGQPILTHLRQPSISAPGTISPIPLGGLLAPGRRAPAANAVSAPPATILHRLPSNGPARIALNRPPPPPLPPSGAPGVPQPPPPALKDRVGKPAEEEDVWGDPVSGLTVIASETAEPGSAATEVGRKSLAFETPLAARAPLHKTRSLKSSQAFAFDRATSMHVKNAIPEERAPVEERRAPLKHFPTANAAYWETTATEWLQPGAPMAAEMGPTVGPPTLPTGAGLSRRAPHADA